jgi:hypothetical protein
MSDSVMRLMPAAACAQHRTETTLLYQLIEQHYPDFRELLAR